MGIIRTAAAMVADNTFGPQFLDRVDFTLSFEHIMLTIVPAALFILALPIHVCVSVRKASVVGAGALLWAKLATALALVACELAVTIRWAQQDVYASQTAIVASATACISCAALVAFLYVEHCYSIRSSGLVAVYLVATIAFDGVKARTQFTRTGLTSIGALYIASMALKVALVILGEFSKKALIRDPATRRDTNPEATSGFWNRVFFFWVNKTMWTGFKSFLHLEDLPSLEAEFRSDHIHAHFHSRWNKADHSYSNSLISTTFFCFWRSHVAVILPRLFLSAFSFAQPFMLEATVRTLGNSGASTSERYWLVLASALIYGGIAASKALSEHFVNRSITLLRGALNAELLNKSLNLTFQQAKESAAVSLMSTDVEGIFDSIHTLHRTWGGLADMGVGFYLLTRLIRQSSFLAALPSFLAFFITIQVGVRVVPATRIWNERFQVRVSETIKFLAQLKAVKMTGRSPMMLKYIQGLREDEIKSSVYKRQLWIIGHTVASTAEFAIPIALIAGGVFWSGFAGGFNSASVFSVLSIVSIISEPLALLPTMISDFAGALACFRRVQEFLLLPERCDTRIIGNRRRSTPVSAKTRGHDEKAATETSEKSNEEFSSDCAVAFRDVSLTYDEQKPPILQGVNLDIKKGELNIVTGPVASGKTTLLEAILGEVKHSVGSIYVHDAKIAYCSQTSFIQNTSIQKNIIGFLPLDVPWYNTVTDGCELWHDFNQIKDGDQSLGGSEGVRLSGGQKQRVAAAQAGYALTEIVVLDNPFSALDSQTSHKVFSNLFAKDTGILRKRGVTIILATQTVEFFSAADRVHVLNGQGSVQTCDNMADLVQFSHSIPNFNLLSADAGKNNRTKKRRSHRNVSKQSSTDAISREESDSGAAVDDDLIDPDLMARKLGDWGSYAFLFKAASLFVYLAWAFFNIVTAILERSSDIYVRIWLDKAADNKWYFFGLPVALVLFFVFHTGWYWQFYSFLVPSLAVNLHEILLETIIRADLTFITSKDNGSILNRFSQDMTYVNTQLPGDLLQVTFLSLAVLISLGIIASGVSYTAAIIPFFLACIYAIIRFYLRTSRQMRHLDLEGKTPLYTHFTETTAGLRHIRSLGRQQDVLRQGLLKLDTAQKPYYYMLCIQRWLTLSLDLLVLAIAVLLEAMALKFVDESSPSAIGLALLNLVSFAQQMERCFIAWTRLETSLGVVARLRSLVRTAPVEAKISPPTDLPPIWPQSGEITFKNVVLSYSLPGKPAVPVLENVECNIFPGARVAATGRTGSGKSSFILALLNLISRTGTISIDGYDPKQLPPDLLRSRITTIPQDPAQLPGTVRDNLIPSDLIDRAEAMQMNDTEIVSILNGLFIWEHIRLNGGLDRQYNDMSFSHGQRQLVALGAAVIQNKLIETKLVIMDEATSHLDYNMDDKVQAYLVGAFGNSTVICVNHRDKGFPKPDITLTFSGGRLDDVVYHSETEDGEAEQDQDGEEAEEEEEGLEVGGVDGAEEPTHSGDSQEGDEQAVQSLEGPAQHKEEVE